MITHRFSGESRGPSLKVVTRESQTQNTSSSYLPMSVQDIEQWVKEHQLISLSVAALVGLDTKASVDASNEAHPARNMQRNVLALTRDVVKLFDLQLQLTYVDLQDFFRRTRLTLVVITMCSVGLLASTPIFMMSVAEFLRRTWDLRMDVALLIVGGVSAFLFSLILILAFWRLSRVSRVLGRSFGEMHQNLTWLREILYHDERDDDRKS